MNFPLNIVPNSFVKVVNGGVVSNPFTLPLNYICENGETALSVELLSLAEKLAIGLYPVVEAAPTFDARYQTLNPVYTVLSESVTLSYTVQDTPLADLRQKAIKLSYRQCKDTLDKHSEGYSPVEIATFPVIQSELMKYNVTGEVGGVMAAIIARGWHTAATLSALLTPKITIEQNALRLRGDNVVFIMGATDLASLVDFIETLA